MENQERQTSDAADWQMNGEEGVPRDLMIVRSILRDLPKVTCPVGFEMRLQRRLAGDFTEPNARNTKRNWALGWTGVGLGLATALVIAVVAFDINFSGISSAPIAAGKAGITSAPVAVTSETKTVSAPSTDVSVPATEKAGAQQLAQEQPKRPVSGKDSSVQSPTTLPDGIMHMVGGNEK